MDEKQTLRAYIEANRRVQAEAKAGQQITLAVLNTFLGVAFWGEDKQERGEPAKLEDLAEHLGVSPNTVSLHMRYLGDRYREQGDGLDLVETHIYPMNRRKKTFRLTHKGQALAKQLAYILGRDDHASTSAR